MRRLTAVSASAAIAALALTGLTVPAVAATGGVLINEFSASTASTDVEYIELLSPPGTDVSAYRVLEIEGDVAATGSPAAFGTIDEVAVFPAADASGRSLLSLPANALENGTISLLLITGTFPALGSDIDANDDGVIDDGLGFTVVDAIAVNDGGTSDLTYGGVTLGVAYDGAAFAPGGASRIPDGIDTDAAGDWVRNDFDLAGIPTFAGTLVEGEAANTPGTANAPWVDPGPPPGDADCAAETVEIHAVQGSGAASPVVGQTVHVQGIVVGDFQEEGSLSGYFLQSRSPDEDALTSEGVFVYAPGDAPVEVSIGDIVNVAGVVSEYASQGGTLTEITAGDAQVCENGADLPAPVQLRLPATPEQREALEGMYVTLPQTLTILEHFEFGRYGTVEVGTTRQVTPTAIVEPGEAAIALAQQQALERITIDDASSLENPDPLLHPNGDSFSLANDLRAGDQLANVTGVLDYHFGTWAVQPTEAADYTPANPRPEVPEVGGDLTVASFNVLNYFTTIGSRGAESDFEFERQEAKIVSAIAAIDADVVGLIEIENSATDAAVATLVTALNDTMGPGTYAYIPTGRLGTDVITNALIYQPASVRPLGAEAVLDSTVDPTFLSNNRPALAQTFTSVGPGEPVTVVVNHLKSKGSACAGDPDTGDGSGNCNLTRTAAAEALVKWLATDPTGQDTVGRELIMGDLNSYDKEDPIDALIAGGYTDLLLRDQGEEAYSYVFDGLVGYLDYALAGTELAPDVTGADVWSINADEAPILDYNVNYKSAGQVDAWFAPDAFRSSDHDPVIVGIDLDTVPPTISATADPALLFPPNGKSRAVTIDVVAADDSGEVNVELVSAVAAGSKKARIEEISDTSFTVTAAAGAVYTFTYRATDAAGNSTTTRTVVRVGR